MEKYKTLNKEIKGVLNKWRDFPCAWIRLNIRMSILPNLIYILNKISVQIPVSCVVDIEEIILKFMWKSKRPRITKQYLRERTKLEDSHYLISR